MKNNMEYNHIPKEPLGFFPTPLIELKRLSAALGGPKIYMKRDDNTGLALGGNKTRKLEFILGDALTKGADTVKPLSSNGRGGGKLRAGMPFSLGRRRAGAGKWQSVAR